MFNPRRWRLTARIVLIRIAYRLGLRPGTVYYVGSHEVLPPPLSHEEEADLLVRLERGDQIGRAHV